MRRKIYIVRHYDCVEKSSVDASCRPNKSRFCRREDDYVILALNISVVLGWKFCGNSRLIRIMGGLALVSRFVSFLRV